jgi:hypothetical protein
VCEEYQSKFKQGMASRGDHGSYEHLTPSLDRVLERGNLPDPRAQYLLERTLVKRFRGLARMHLSPSESALLETFVSTLTLMRHFGAPTRLLDWSGSIWISLYFASYQSPDKPASIWAFDKYRLEDSLRTRHCGAVHDQLYAKRGDGDPEITWHDADADDWLVPIYVQDHRFPRIIAQQGMFTLASRLQRPHDDLLGKLLRKSDRVHIQFPKELKPGVLEMLEGQGVTGASLYPDLIGIGHHLSDFAHWAHNDRGFQRLQASLPPLRPTP